MVEPELLYFVKAELFTNELVITRGLLFLRSVVARFVVELANFWLVEI